MTKTNVQPPPSNSKHHDTPNNKTHVIKFRVTAEEKASLELTCKLLNLSLSTFIRRALHSAAGWAAISTNSHDTLIPAVQTPSRYERKSLTNLQT